MKKIYSIIAMLMIISLALSGCFSIPIPVKEKGEEESSESATLKSEEPTEIEPDYSLYKPYMQEVLDNLPDDEYARALGVLYDVGLNNVKELIMMYDSDTVQHPNSDMKGMAVAYSVYTIKDNEVVEIEKEHFLFPMAGGPQGVAYVLEGYEENLLGFKYAEVNPGDNDLYCKGNWYIYSVDGPHNEAYNHEDEFPQEVEYYYSYALEDGYENIDYLDSTATSKSDERDGSYEWFHKWLSEHQQTEILRYGLDNEEQSLEVLMNTL